MDVQQAILQRRSTRGFEKTPLTQQEIDTLVQAALAAPSAMNKQPWHFAFVKDAGLLKEFNALAREHMLKNGPAPLRPRFEDPNYELLMGAPLFVILSTDPTGDGPFTGVDCGIAVENLALSAKGMGLGSVIVGMPMEIVEADCCKDLKTRMGVPAGHRYKVGILIGHNNASKEAHPQESGRVSIV